MPWKWSAVLSALSGSCGLSQAAPEKIVAVAISSDGGKLAGACDDCCLRVWNLRTGALDSCLRFAGRLSTVAFSADGRNLAAGGPDGHVYLLRTTRFHPVWSSLLPSRDIQTVAFSPDGETLACATRPSDLARLISVRTGRVERSLDYPGNGMGGLAFLPDGHTLVTGGQVLNVWDLRRARSEGWPAADSGDKLIAASRRALVHESVMGWTTALALAPNGRMLVAAGDASQEDQGRPISFVLVDPSLGKVVRRVAKLPAMVLSITVSRDGRYVAAGDEAGIVRVWVLPSGRTCAVGAAALGAIRGVAFASDGNLIAAGDQGIRAFKIVGPELVPLPTLFRF